MGDFNETLYGEEHFNSTTRPEWQMRAFRDVVSDCAFQDLGWSGVPYTWDNQQSGNANVKARLDRAFANEEFRHKFEYFKVCHICSVESDHCFVLTDVRQQPPNSNSHTSKPFRYENIWQYHNDYDQLVTETWRAQARQPGLHGVMNSLEALQRKLMPWGVREFGCLTRTVRQLQKQLDRLRCQLVGRGPSQEETSTMSKL